VVAFPGKLRHGGAPVTRGRRYIIPLFIYADTNASGRKPGYVRSALPEVDEGAGAAALSRYAASVAT
jgi:predicted 2-oxoglutarate/Fe(II)-dependent dioxygenase YbiX